MSRQEKVAGALSRVRAVMDARGVEVIRTRDLERIDREILATTGWLQEITRGWYFLTRPDVAPGDTGPWYSHYWDFLRCYLHERFGQDYCLSAECSLALHTGNTLVPEQMIAIVSRGAGNPITLPFETSLLAYSGKLPTEIEEVRGLRVMPLSLALCRLAPAAFERDLTEVQLALNLVDIDELSRALMEGNFERAAGRIATALPSEQTERLKRNLTGMRITLPEQPLEMGMTIRTHSPYAARIEATWAQMRQTVIDNFAPPPGLPEDPDRYLKHVDDLYQIDAYHSLSIEGYRVSPELIDRVQNQQWNPDANEDDHQSHRALAARGYYEAYQQVEKSLAEILGGRNPGEVAEQGLREWYRALWAPHAHANLLKSHDLLGYRRGPVYIRGSRHTPLPREALVDAMCALFACLQTEQHPGVRAVLGHYIFVFIHPYPDGNGRIGRFLMNAMLASGGYPWTVVRVDHRDRYFGALENTHLTRDIGPFARLIAEEMRLSVPSA